MSRSPDSPGSHIALQTARILLHSGTDKKENIAFSAERSVTASLVGSFTRVFNRCGDRCEVAGTA